MEAVILEFSRRRICQCGYCGRKMKRRSERNEPACCSYTCGVNGQPEKAKRVLFNRGVNEGV